MEEYKYNASLEIHSEQEKSSKVVLKVDLDTVERLIDNERETYQQIALLLSEGIISELIHNTGRTINYTDSKILYSNATKAETDYEVQNGILVNRHSIITKLHMIDEKGIDTAAALWKEKGNISKSISNSLYNSNIDNYRRAA